ncbi:MAG: YtxH domain-containing protein [bacterium]|nr:YtxH domain-containing protein [bacterium]
MEERDSSLSLIFAFIAGAACGAVAGILLAPYSGLETRKKIGEAAEKAKEKGGELAHEIRDKVGVVVETGKKKIEEILSEGKEVVAEKKSMLTKAIEAGKKAAKEEKERLEA